MKNNFTKSNELRMLAIDEKNNIIDAYKKKTLNDYLSDRVLDVSFNDEGNPEYLYFTLGGPVVFLTLASNKGILFAEHGGQIERSAISWCFKDDIEEIVLDFIENHFPTIGGKSYEK